MAKLTAMMENNCNKANIFIFANAWAKQDIPLKFEVNIRYVYLKRKDDIFIRENLTTADLCASNQRTCNVKIALLHSNYNNCIKTRLFQFKFYCCCHIFRILKALSFSLFYLCM